MATTHRRYDAYIQSQLAKGIHPYQAGLDPEARMAFSADMAEAREQDRVQKEWPTEKDHFADADELQAAMSDPAYRVNPHYRAKVEKLLANSPALLVPKNTQGDGQGITDETMRANMLADARRAATKQAFRDAAGDPIKTLALYDSIAQDTEGQSDEIEQAFTNEGPLQRASRMAGFQRVGPSLETVSEKEENTNPFVVDLGPAGKK